MKIFVIVEYIELFECNLILNSKFKPKFNETAIHLPGANFFLLRV